MSDQPQRRYNNQDGNGRELQISIPLGIPLDIPPAPVQPTARRILSFDDLTNQDIISTLSSISWTNRQVMHVSTGTGYVSQATFLSSQTRQQVVYNQVMLVEHMCGWFQPGVIPHPGVPFIPADRGDGRINVSIRGLLASSAIATSLIGHGPFEVNVTFLCGPASVIPPDEPGAQPIRLRYVNIVPPPQGPVP